ncbi:hypothetical protein [Actinomadura sp. 3N407]|uniref:hypothetical protein n=1 Tax=Actinomadura sp. 3N407 TaxID=3457423 RepID=UPI003FCD5D3C
MSDAADGAAHGVVVPARARRRVAVVAATVSAFQLGIRLGRSLSRSRLGGRRYN